MAWDELLDITPGMFLEMERQRLEGAKLFGMAAAAGFLGTNDKPKKPELLTYLKSKSAPPTVEEWRPAGPDD